MRGRKPTPTKLKILAGNPGKRDLNDQEPRPAAAIPDCPAHLDAEARAEWERVAGELLALGLLTKVDRAALAAYCQTWSRWVKAEQRIAVSGEVLKGENGFYQNPFLSVANRSLELMHRFLTEFGLSPASRSRLKVGGDDGDALERFLKSG